MLLLLKPAKGFRVVCDTWAVWDCSQVSRHSLLNEAPVILNKVKIYTLLLKNPSPRQDKT